MQLAAKFWRNFLRLSWKLTHWEKLSFEFCVNAHLHIFGVFSFHYSLCLKILIILLYLASEWFKFFIRAFIYLRTKKTLQRAAKAFKIKNYLVLVFGSWINRFSLFLLEYILLQFLPFHLQNWMLLVAWKYLANLHARKCMGLLYTRLYQL